MKSVTYLLDEYIPLYETSNDAYNPVRLAGPALGPTYPESKTWRKL